MSGDNTTADDFGPALAEFVAIAAYRLATSPSSLPSDDEMAAYHRVVAAFNAARPLPPRDERRPEGR